MSKRTTVYTLYTKLSNNAASIYGMDAGVTTGAVAAGNRLGAAGAFGADPSAFSLGMKHAF